MKVHYESLAQMEMTTNNLVGQACVVSHVKSGIDRFVSTIHQQPLNQATLACPRDSLQISTSTQVPSASMKGIEKNKKKNKKLDAQAKGPKTLMSGLEEGSGPKKVSDPDEAKDRQPTRNRDRKRNWARPIKTTHTKKEKYHLILSFVQLCSRQREVIHHHANNGVQTRHCAADSECAGLLVRTESF